MAVVYISEYAKLGREAYGGPGTNIQAPLEPAIRNQTVAIGASSIQSSEFSKETTIVLVATDAICSVKFGANPNAKSTDMRLAANTSQFFAVAPGSQLKVAVITNS